MSSWKDKRILVAEDEMANFMLVSVLLERTAVNITHAANGKKAVELCGKEKFDVVLMDIKMPLMDGFEATGEIRKFNSFIPIIAQTAYAYKKEECVAAGFTDYISKPFNRDKLVKLLEKYLNGN
jgi:two-component system, sensor histidine kinase